MRKKEILKGIGALIIYFVMAFTNLQVLPFTLLNIDTNTLPRVVSICYSIFYQLLMLLFVSLLFWKELKESWKDLKYHHKEYFQKYFKYWFLMLGLMMISNLMIQIVLPDSIAGNEETIRELFQVSPIYIFVASVLIAPFLEEFVFRLGIRKLIKNDTLFIILSGLIFGALHIVGNVEVPLDCLYLIPYSIPGFIFAYILTKTDNIFTTAFLHMFHNGVLISLQFLVYFIL